MIIISKTINSSNSVIDKIMWKRLIEKWKMPKIPCEGKILDRWRDGWMNRQQTQRQPQWDIRIYIFFLYFVARQCFCLDMITEWLCFWFVRSWSQSGLVQCWFSVKLYMYNRTVSRPSHSRSAPWMSGAAFLFLSMNLFREKKGKVSGCNFQNLGCVCVWFPHHYMQLNSVFLQ